MAMLHLLYKIMRALGNGYNVQYFFSQPSRREKEVKQEYIPELIDHIKEPLIRASRENAFSALVNGVQHFLNNLADAVLSTLMFWLLGSQL